MAGAPEITPHLGGVGGYGGAMRLLLLAASAAFLFSCGGFKKDLDTICHVRERVSMPAGADAEKQEAVITEFLVTNVKSPEAKRMYATFGSKTRAEQAKVLRDTAAKQGVSPCPLADELDRPVAAPKPAAPAAAPAPAPEAAPAAAPAAPAEPQK